MVVILASRSHDIYERKYIQTEKEIVYGMLESIRVVLCINTIDLFIYSLFYDLINIQMCQPFYRVFVSHVQVNSTNVNDKETIN